MQNRELDVPCAAIITSEHTIERILDTYPSSVKDSCWIRPSPRKMLLERSMGWIVVESETYAVAPT